MEKIYPPSKFPCSEQMALKNYFLKFSNACSLNSDPDFSRMSDVKQAETLLNIHKVSENSERKELLDNISLDLLDPGEETCVLDTEPKYKALSRFKNPHEINDEALELETVDARKNYQRKFSDIYTRYRRRAENYVSQATELGGKADIVEGTEYAVAVRVYHPFEYNYSSNPNSYHNLKFSHEITILGSNTLADLRDKTVCHSDAGVASEVDDPKVDLFIANAKEKYPSGFIFIDNVFYNDLRNANAFDYSDVIRDWAAEKNIGPLLCGNIDTRIDELKPRLGYPYIYQHQGRCEHVLVFTDAWLLTNKDSLNLKNYPAYTGIHRFYSKHCTMCYVQSAHWVVTDSNRLAHSKTFFCQECFLSYNYKDGKKLGEFKAYPFFDRSSLL